MIFCNAISSSPCNLNLIIRCAAQALLRKGLNQKLTFFNKSATLSNKLRDLDTIVELGGAELPGVEDQRKGVGVKPSATD